MPSIVTSEAVAAAVANLQTTGQRPSIRNIRSVLGGGSLGDISRQLRLLRDQTAQQAGDPQHPDLIALEHLAPGSTARLREAFRATVQQELDAAAEARAEAERHAHELEGACDDLEGQVVALTAQVAQLEERLATLGRHVELIQSLPDQMVSMSDAIGADLATRTQEFNEALSAEGDRADARWSEIRAATHAYHERMEAHQAEAQGRTQAQLDALVALGQEQARMLTALAKAAQDADTKATERDHRLRLDLRPCASRTQRRLRVTRTLGQSTYL